MIIFKSIQKLESQSTRAFIMRIQPTHLGTLVVETLGLPGRRCTIDLHLRFEGHLVLDLPGQTWNGPTGIFEDNDMMFRRIKMGYI